MVRAETPSFNTALRFELVSDEGRALAGSYLVAVLLAITWLALVHLVPRPLGNGGESPLVIVLDHPDLVPPSAREPVREAAQAVGATLSRIATLNANTIRAAFGGNTGLGGGGNPLRGVTVTGSGTPGGHQTARAVPLGTGPGSGTPGRGRMGGAGPVGSGLGVVSGVGVTRANVAIAPPEVRAVAAGSSPGDVTEVGRTARAHAPQLQRCYQEEGLMRNPSLAGLVRLAIDVEGGRVTAARVVYRSWTGAGVAETESCLIGAIRGWRLGASSASLTLPFSFTSSGGR